MDYFDILLAKKLSGGGGGEITVEGLSVEENGTYTAPSGKAYSPVVVNLPLGEKSITANGEYLASADDLKGFSKVTVNVAGFTKKAMPTGAISSFNDGTANPLTKLKIAINPVQAGSGDPSPTNPRAISGWTGANIHIADGETPHIIDNVVNISWQTEVGTVYGGELDVTSGVLKVDKIGVKVKDLSWTYQSSGLRFYTSDLASVIKTPADNTQALDGFICEVLKNLSANQVFVSEGCIGVASSGNIFLRNTAWDEEEELISAIGDNYIVYPIITTQTYQLTPTQVSSILGTNNIWADTGDILEGEYFTSL